MQEESSNVFSFLFLSFLFGARRHSRRGDNWRVVRVLDVCAVFVGGYGARLI